MAVHGALARADEHLGDLLIRPDGVSRFLADLGAVPVAVPVLAAALAVAALLARRAGAPRWWLPSLLTALLMAAVPLVVVPLKELIDRPGPPVMAPDTGFYPSGHTATAAVAYGGAALVLWPWLRGAWARACALALCVALNAGTGFGLVRHGYHWPLDVVGSWCLCALLLIGLAVLLARWRSRPQD
ncbi:phosphatase PAP2 family protein [Streptomyces sp. CRN 30]|uniref:phosphatase PAP2 family protein n=1 Tax=Streptomyces sp. CRN 30 TaxID=3075613 RepID=UPI002A828D9D|nr:phosphatase PAP2 family protein [Streptomyces sp. CRN 30]